MNTGALCPQPQRRHPMNSEPPESYPADRDIDPRDVRILVVDDTTANLDIMVQLLEPEGYNLAIATDGEKAIKVARHFRPDLILLDVMMPGMDGFDTCTAMQADPDLRNIPILFVTARKEPAAIEQGFRCGGRDYITKPFQHAEVMARIRTHIRLYKLIQSQVALIGQLRKALTQVKTLHGLLPICAACKSIRDDQGYWHQIEAYITAHADVNFSHGLCKACAKKLYPNLKYD